MTVAVILVVGSDLVAEPAAQAVRESRTHFDVVARGEQRVIYSITRISRVLPSRSEMTYLVEDRSGGTRYILAAQRNYESQSDTFVIRRAAPAGSSTDQVSATIELPLKPDTPMGTNSQLLAMRDRGDLAAIEAAIPVTIATAGRGQRSSERARADQWRGPAGSERRKNVRERLSPEFAGEIATLHRDLFHLPHFAEFCTNLTEHLLDDGCAPNERVAIRQTSRTCDFDRSFGFPCSR